MKKNKQEETHDGLLDHINMLTKQLAEANAYADELVTHKDMVCLPKDLENLREANLELAKENELWKEEAKRWRDMYLQFDEMLDGQVNDAVLKLEKVWVGLDELKKEVEDKY